MSARVELAEGIAAGLPAGSRVSVYPYPADLVKAPAVVIRPGDPYLEPSTYDRRRVNLEVDVIVPRTRVEDQLTALEELIDTVLSAIAADPRSRRFQWEQVSAPGELTQGDIAYLGSTITTYTALEGS